MKALVVGAGVTGCVIAHTLKNAGHRVEVIDSRSHLAGNMFDFRHAGIWQHQYGPHYFRTKNRKLWEWLQNFGEWYNWRARVLTRLSNGTIVNWPPQRRWIESQGWDLRPAFVGRPSNFEEASLSFMSQRVYDEFVEPYTRKQWGVDPSSLDSSVAHRFAIRDGPQELCPEHLYQGIPKDGYTTMLGRMLRGVQVFLGVYYEGKRGTSFDKVFFTGSLDTLCEMSLGGLRYRSQQRKTTIRWNTPSIKATQLNSPSHATRIRTLFWNNLPGNKGKGGSLETTETPFSPIDPDKYEYPFPSEEARSLHQEYRALSVSNHPNVVVCGRLGTYKYLDMDQAMLLARKIANEHI